MSWRGPQGLWSPAPGPENCLLGTGKSKSETGKSTSPAEASGSSVNPPYPFQEKKPGLGGTGQEGLLLTWASKTYMRRPKPPSLELRGFRRHLSCSCPMKSRGST